MLSVCIPVYRFFVLPQVCSRDSGPGASPPDADPHATSDQLSPESPNHIQQLYIQLKATGIDFEIRVYEDASPPPYPAINEKVSELGPEVNYCLLEKNLGRAAIRNLLAQEARYPQILFLDADSGIPDGFVANYLPYLDSSRYPLVAGGRIYPALSTVAAAFQLHCRYGTIRERLDPQAKGDALYQGFQTNNFMVSRELLLRHPFPIDFTGYGHEDTLWGWQLRAMSIPVIRIDNPVIHLGLEEATVFLQKQEEAIVNLRTLERQAPDLPTRLSSFARRWQWLKPVLFPCLARLESRLKKGLLRQPPAALWALDALKLYWYWK